MRVRLRLLYYGFFYLWHIITMLNKGQKCNYELLQLAHRLEKGLTIHNPKLLWGWEKAYAIYDKLKTNNDSFSTNTATGVLNAYLYAKSLSENEVEREALKNFLSTTHWNLAEPDGMGGVMEISPRIFNEEELVLLEDFFNSRHSIRTFSGRYIKDSDIKRAIDLALRCPSACNRQPYKIYVIPPVVIEKEIKHKLQYNADKILIVTGDIRAYNSGEIYDWIVSPSIFAAYLSLSLHALGIGSCIIRKELFRPDNYNEIIRSISGMDESEQIILEMAVGYYDNSILVPVSNRANAADLTKFIRDE